MKPIKPFASAAACALALAGTAWAGSMLVGAEPASALSWAGREQEVVQALFRYCTASWRQARIAPQDWDDCTQQVLLDLWERLDRERIPASMELKNSPEHRELVRAVWRTAQQWRRARRAAPLPEETLPQRPSSGADIARRSIESAMAASGDLSNRQRVILDELMDGSRIAEIAVKLDDTPARVSDEKYKALRKLRRQIEA